MANDIPSILHHVSIGTNDLEAYWDGWSGATRPALTHATMLSGRGKAVAEVHRRLAE